MKKRTSGWVLYCEIAGYFRYMTKLGPACTQELDVAHVFDTKDEALGDPASHFIFTSFTPVEVEAVWV